MFIALSLAKICVYDIYDKYYMYPCEYNIFVTY